MALAVSRNMDHDQFGDENVCASNILSPRKKERLDKLLMQATKVSQQKPISNPIPKVIVNSKVDRSSKQRVQIDKPANDVQLREVTLNPYIRFESTPTYIKGVMRDYQLRGLNWMISMYERNVNGILADEMGLGKTLQTISLLGFLKCYKKIDGPFLVIGPKSTVWNWFNEVKRFCPTLKPIVFTGSKEDREDIKHKLAKDKWDVMLTTYQMILNETSTLKRISWKYLVVDEAQRMKNENCKFNTILSTFKSKNRMLLTGTPLQNNLHELWSLLNFLMPDIFSDPEEFDMLFDSNDCLKGNNDVAARLRKLLQPFMIRRVKAEVEKSLLPKIEVKLFVGMTQMQREVYKKILRKELTKTNHFGEESAKAIKFMLMELRKCVNHPYLIENVEPQPYTTDEHLVNSCGKMLLMDKLLGKLKSQGSRVVLFSQFRIMLDIIEDYLNMRGYEYRRLDGSTRLEDRVNGIDDFNAPNSSVFIYIISTRAGGLGINLYTADSVVIYDSDWNPQPDYQAIDRVHRIGQTKQVRIYRLVNENTVDERIIQRAEIKARLDKMIIQQGRSIDAKIRLNKGMKEDIIRFGMDKILSENGDSMVDIDIDQILKDGAAKTAEEHAKLSELDEGKLRTMTLEEAASVSIYQFEGIDFRKNTVGDIDCDTGVTQADTRLLHDYQFYPEQLFAYATSISSHFKKQMSINFDEDRDIKQRLYAKGFPNWSRFDLSTFCKAMAKFGRDNIEGIVTMLPGKSLEDVRRYHQAFWSRGMTELNDFHLLIKKVLKAEGQKKRDIQRKKMEEPFFEPALNWKINQYHSPEEQITIEGVSRNQYSYKQSHDNFLLVNMHKYGFKDVSVYARIKEMINTLPKFKMQFKFKKRTAEELESRGTFLLKMIALEFTERMIEDDNKSASSDESVTSDVENDHESLAKRRRLN